MRKNKQKPKFFQLLVVFLIILPLVSCTSFTSDAVQEGERISDTNATTNPRKTPSPTASVEAISVVPSVTIQTTAIHTIAPTPKPFLTLTPLPTIPVEKRGEVYDELMKNNGGCSLPCWWGFEMGISSLEQVRQFYATFDPYITEQKINEDISMLTIQFVDPEINDGKQVNHTFISSDEIVIEAEINAESPYYQIEPLLQQLDLPSDIWVWTIPEPYQGVLPSRFRLFFPEKGVLALYGVGGTKANETVDICFDAFGGTSLMLWEPNHWDPNRNKDITERAAEGGSAFQLEGYPIEEVTNWNVEQFYEIVSNPMRTECLETSGEFWSKE